MPKLLLFIGCEKVIISQHDNTVSVINILQQLQIGMPAEAEILEQAAIPLRWCGFSMWYRQPEDEGKRYNQEVVLYAPDGSNLVSARTSFEMQHLTERIVSEFTNFPIKQFGSSILKLYLEENEEEKKEVAQFPLEISRGMVKAN